MKLLFVKFPFGTEMRMSQQNHEGGWSGIGMATVGIHPNDFDLYPNKIPPGRVVQNCRFGNMSVPEKDICYNTGVNKTLNHFFGPGIIFVHSPSNKENTLQKITKI